MFGHNPPGSLHAGCVISPQGRVRPSLPRILPPPSPPPPPPTAPLLPQCQNIADATFQPCHKWAGLKRGEKKQTLSEERTVIKMLIIDINEKAGVSEALVMR